LKIAIITRPDERSPKILAIGFQAMCKELAINCEIFYDIAILIRMQPLTQKLKFPFSLTKRIYSKIKFFHQEKIFLRKLSSYDIIIISECTPNGFWRGYYAIEILKNKLKKPILYYEVYFLGNAPTQLTRLLSEGDVGIQRYDWHLAVTDITEIRSSPGEKWSRIGLNLENTGLRPNEKKDFLVLIDFEQTGYEQLRKDQIDILNEIEIPYIALEGNYKIEDIRKLYLRACVFLIQSPEAFGLPIAECLSCGAYIMTPDSSWPMSWRLDDNPMIHSKGVLPDCFEIYTSKEDLRFKLLQIKSQYNLQFTPQKVFSTFINYYPHFYFGEIQSLKNALTQFSNATQ
jgi:hypothetical protein